MSFRLVIIVSILILQGLPLPGDAAEGLLSSSVYVRISQSSDATTTNLAARAMDGLAGTCSLTRNEPGSYWMAELGRAYSLTKIEIVNRAAPDDTTMGGAVFRLFNMDDQIVYQTNLVNPGPGGMVTINLPLGMKGRALWIGLPGGQTNDAGNYQVGIAEVRAYGGLTMPYGPEPAVAGTNQFKVWQSSEYGSYPAENAVDGNASTYTHTADVVDSCWMADLGRVAQIDKVEVVNRPDCCNNRLAGLVLRIFDGASNSISSVTLADVGLGGTYTYYPPVGTMGRWIRIGLENGQKNGGANYYVTLAEVRAYSGTNNLLVATANPSVPVTNNLASYKKCYMVRLSPTLATATNANDNDYSTETKTTTQTVDGYWEVDLGATYALYSVRTIAASGIGTRMTNTTVRLFDEAHDSVYAQRLAGVPDSFDSDLNGPWFARYVRVGLEDKRRTSPSGATEWYIGMREVEVFGRPTNEVGILSLNISTQRVVAAQPVLMSWKLEDVKRVELHPSTGSVGAYTALSGDGSITLMPTQSTEFILLATNSTALFSRAVGVEVDGVALTPYISELIADNKYSMTDGNGDASDWIEIRNPGNAEINLAGYGLSDDPANPMKWVFPNLSLAPHAMLMVFASGQDIPFDAAGNVHASFKLDKAGGSLILTSPGTNILDSVVYPEQETDLAYGRDLEGGWKFMEPTPGVINTGITYDGWLKTPDVSHQRGFYSSSFVLTVTNNNAGANVLYSLDGTNPSLTYSNGLAISGTKTVRVQSTRANYRPSRVVTKTYIFPDDVISSSLLSTTITQDTNYAPRLRPGLMALPSICLVAPGTLSYQEQEGSVEVIMPDGQTQVQENCGVYYYGGSWQAFAKRSFTVAFRTKYGAGKLQVPLFNGFDRGVQARTSFDKLELNAGNQDMVLRGFYMADRFVQDSMLEMGSLNPHGRFVHLYLNGVYWGQYNCKEVLMEDFLASYLGGKSEDYVSVKGNDNVGDDFVLGTPDAPIIEPWERVVGFKNSYQSVRSYLDVSHLIDFMLLWNYGYCESEFRSCGTREAGTGFKFWMADSDGFLRTNVIGMNRTVRNGPGGLWGGLMGEGNSDFKTLLADRIYKHFFNNGALTPTRNDARLAARMQEINDSMLLECARWGFRTPVNWMTDYNTIRTRVFPNRTADLLAILRNAGWFPAFDPPTFNQYGGIVPSGFQPQLSTTAGVIYYTLDGSDPRLPGGMLSASALIWVPGAVTITRDMVLSARVLGAGGQWSALAQPRYYPSDVRVPGPKDLIVTEIQYNPDGGDDEEFIELYNASSSPLDLSGMSIDNAVRFIISNGTVLSPGAFALVVKDVNAFGQRYQNPASPWYWEGINVLGAWSGSLNNAGETVSLIASNGVQLYSITYKPGGKWPGRADGNGSSLELRHLPHSFMTGQEVGASMNNGDNWGASSLYHGSPGRIDGFVKVVRINELMPNPLTGEDWVELHNDGSQAVSLNHCALTDDLGQPSRYLFPPDAVLLPDHYLVMSASQLGFAFGEMGEKIHLLQLSGTNVIRFLDVVDFSAAAPGESFGVYQRLDGDRDFTGITRPTIGAANALPQSGPLVISEILFRPASGNASFIELASLTNVPVELYDPLFPTNTWRVEGVASFAFPTGMVVVPNGRLILCSPNPEAFRAQYGVSDTVPVVGPWSGTLDVDGETIKIMRPGTPQTNGLPYYCVDHVAYLSGSTWPPVNEGMSFQKAQPGSYGNDSMNWCAGVPNPGMVESGKIIPQKTVQPVGMNIDEGQTASFSVIVTGTPPYSFQWRCNEIPIAGATNNTIQFANATISMAGEYDVVVFSSGGGALSATAVLRVSKPPIISLQPVSQSVRAGSNTTFLVAASGNGVVRYQWRLNGISIPGATNTTLFITNAGVQNAGNYTVVISDALGMATSSNAVLTLLVDPVIVQQPLSQPVVAGGTVVLSVSVTNTATLPINYRWRRGGFTHTNQYLNSYISFLVITNAQAYTNWSVLVTNIAKPGGIASSNAYLTILADTNSNGFPDVWETRYGFGPGHPLDRDGDGDGDGMSNWQEYQAGTDPTNAASCLRVEIPASKTGGVRFYMTSNHTCTVQYSDVLGTNTWIKLVDLPARNSNSDENVDDPGWTTNRFYRVVIPAQP